MENKEARDQFLKDMFTDLYHPPMIHEANYMGVFDAQSFEISDLWKVLIERHSLKPVHDHYLLMAMSNNHSLSLWTYIRLLSEDLEGNFSDDERNRIKEICQEYAYTKSCGYVVLAIISVMQNKLFTISDRDGHLFISPNYSKEEAQKIHNAFSEEYYRKRDAKDAKK